MATITKIGFLRDEFERIGCAPPKDPFAPRLYVGWHYTQILVCGIQEKLFDFDVLCAILEQVPDGVGEEHFWREVDRTDINAVIDKLNRQHLSVVN